MQSCGGLVLHMDGRGVNQELAIELTRNAFISIHPAQFLILCRWTYLADAPNGSSLAQSVQKVTH